MNVFLMISLHDTKIDPREKFILDSVLATEDYDVLFLGIGDHYHPLKSANVINLPEENLSYWDLIRNTLFVIRYREKIMRPFMLLTITLLPIAFALRVILTIAPIIALFIKLQHRFKKLCKGKISSSKNETTIKSASSTSFASAFPRLKSYIVDSKNLGFLIRLTWNIHFHLIHKNRILLRYVEKNMKRIEVIHANDFDTFITALILQNKFSSKIVYDSQEFFPDSNSVFSRAEKAFYSGIDRKYCHKADVVVTVTPQLGSHIKKVYDLKRVFIIPNAYPKNNSLVPDKLVTENTKKKFVFQGNFSLNRGLEILISAWKSQGLSKVAELYLVGPNNRHKEKLMNLARSLNIINKGVFFPEAVSPEDLVHNLRSYDVGVIPYPPIDNNFRFCCPNKLGQYMAAGIAVLSNELPFVDSMIELASCGHSYKFNDERSLAEEVVKFCNSESLAVLKVNSKAFHEKVFNWEKIGERFILLYQEINYEINESDSGPLTFVV
jgi:glycosyltransferase involved in cell wall biosynthesis